MVKGGVEPVRTFSGQEGGQFFAILCGRPLWTAPKVLFIDVKRDEGAS